MKSPIIIFLILMLVSMVSCSFYQYEDLIDNFDLDRFKTEIASDIDFSIDKEQNISSQTSEPGNSETDTGNDTFNNEEQIINTYTPPPDDGDDIQLGLWTLDWSPNYSVAFDTEKWRLEIENDGSSSLVLIDNNECKIINPGPMGMPDDYSTINIGSIAYNVVDRLNVDDAFIGYVAKNEVDLETQCSPFFFVYVPETEIEICIKEAETILATLMSTEKTPEVSNNPSDLDTIVYGLAYDMAYGQTDTFKKIIPENGISYGTGMSGGRTTMDKTSFLTELEKRIEHNPTCVGYRINDDEGYITLWTKNWQPVWYFEDIQSEELKLDIFTNDNGHPYLGSAYFTPSSGVFDSQQIEYKPCPEITRYIVTYKLPTLFIKNQ